MPLLFLLRHAKSDWDSPALPDRDRPLARRGRAAAAAMARYLHEHHIRPDVVLCSPARRTAETLTIIADSLGPDVETSFEEAIYGADAAWLLARLHALPAGTGSAMLVGHNPGIQQLALMVAGGSSPEPAVQKLAENYPTGALAILHAPGSWADLGSTPATSVALVTPKDLERSGRRD